MPCVHFATGYLLYQSNADLRRQLSWWDTIDTNSIGAAPINTLTETTTTWGAGSAGTVLGKRARNRYELFNKAPNRLTTTTPDQARVGPWMRQRVPGRGSTLRQTPGPNIQEKNTSMKLWGRAERLAPQQPRDCIPIQCRGQVPCRRWRNPRMNYKPEEVPKVRKTCTRSLVN